MKIKNFLLIVAFIYSTGNIWADNSWTTTGTSPHDTYDNAYVISSAAQLENMANASVNNSYTGIYFKLGSNINMSTIFNWPRIGHSSNNFRGIFDGNGFEITGFTISSTENNVGLFSLINGSCEIKNIILRIGGDGVKGSSQVGGLVGQSSSNDTKITNCHVYGNVQGNNNNGYSIVGGLIGTNRGDITDCSFEGFVSGYENIGGLVGRQENGGEISDCYANCEVSGSHANIGGLVGYNGNSPISNCNAIGNVIGSNISDQVGGLVGTNSSTITNCYFEGDVSGRNQIGGLVGRHEENNNISDSYAISNVTGEGNEIGGLMGINYNSSISNCYAIGDVTGSSISDYVGGLVGINNRVITGCFSEGAVKGRNQIGGLIGRQESGGQTSDSYAISNVTGEGNEIGGLIGFSYDSPISKCYAVGNVEGSSNSGYVGGLVGSNNSPINDSYSTGNTITGSYQVGGLVGRAESNGTIINSYAAYNSVSGNSQIGGLVGYNATTLTDSYAKPANNLYVGYSDGSGTVTDIDDATDGLSGMLGVLNNTVWGVTEDNYPYLTDLRKHTITYVPTNNNPTIVNYSVSANMILNIDHDLPVGYHFTEGWFDAATGNDKVTFPLCVVKDTFIYGRSDNKNTINLDANGGSVFPTSIQVTYGTAIGTLPTPDRSGYDFDGWYYNNTQYTATTVYKESTDITLQARWTQLVEASIVSQPQGGGDFCEGNNIMLTVTAKGTGLKYQWYKDGNAINEATSADYIITYTQKSHSGAYAVEVTANIGEPVMSNRVVITIYEPPKIVNNLTDVTFSASPAILQIIATGDIKSYQWYYDGVAIPGAVTESIKIYEDGYYYVKVFGNGPCGSIDSRIALVTFEYANIVINRKITLLKTTGVITNPDAGVYYVESRGDFVFEMWPASGYSLDNVKVTNDKGFEVIIEPIEEATANSKRLRVMVKRINTTTTIAIEGAVESNSQVGETPVHDNKVWSYNDRVYFALPEPAEISIYTISGILYDRRRLPAGNTSLQLPPGFYIIRKQGANETKIIID